MVLLFKLMYVCIYIYRQMGENISPKQVFKKEEENNIKDPSPVS